MQPKKKLSLNKKTIIHLREKAILFAGNKGPTGSCTSCGCVSLDQTCEPTRRINFTKPH